jgi:hypothetical protein
METKMSKWRPSWWTDEVHGAAWERVKEAMRRDWKQTRHELGVGGHEMNQTLTDTVPQAAAKEHVPTVNEANPPKVIGDWSEVEIPYGYGYGARTEFGAQHPQWNEGLEQLLEGEWVAAEDYVRYDWGTVRSLVRCGYEFHENESARIQAAVGASAHQPNREHPQHR